MASEKTIKDVPEARRRSLFKSSGSIESQKLYDDDDAAKLAEMGYSQDMPRGFSIWSVLGTSFSLTNSWFGISTGLSTSINAGGPVLLIYGIIIFSIASAFTGASLSELASAIPNAGGQYYWTSKLAPRKYANIASYLTGWFAYAGAIFTAASIALAMGSAVVGMYQLSHPDFEIQTWHIIVAYELFNFAVYFLNCWGKILPKLAQFTIGISLVSFFIILVAVPAGAPTHQPAHFVFAEFINNTGWQSGGVAFITGLINAGWAFAGLDCATHLAEEVARPERVIPMALMATVLIGFVTSWFYSMSMMFSVQDLATVVSSPTLLPIIELFNQAINKAGALGLESLIFLTGIGCLTACQTWQARLCWSFSRDGGLPGHQWLGKVNDTLETPLMAHTVSAIINGLIGLIYLGSSAAFNSMITGSIVLLYLSYAVPIICLLVKGRDNITHGPFWLGKFGLFCNWFTLIWTVFSLVMFSLPVQMPATAGTMNYVSAVYAVIAIIVTVDWFARGRKEFCNAAKQEERKQSYESYQQRRRSSMGRVPATGSEGTLTQQSNGS